MQETFALANIIAISNGAPEFGDLTAPLQPEQRVIDLVGIKRRPGVAWQNKGIRW